MKNIFLRAMRKGVVLFVTSMFLGCGHDINVNGETRHTVQGEARVVMSVDIEVCDQIKDEEKRDRCILDAIEMMSKMQELKEEEAE